MSNQSTLSLLLTAIWWQYWAWSSECGEKIPHSCRAQFSQWGCSSGSQGAAPNAPWFLVLHTHVPRGSVAQLLCQRFSLLPYLHFTLYLPKSLPFNLWNSKDVITSSLPKQVSQIGPPAQLLKIIGTIALRGLSQSMWPATQCHKLGDLNFGNLLLTALEARKSRSRWQQIQFLVRPKPGLQMVTLLVVRSQRKRKGSILSSSSSNSTNPIIAPALTSMTWSNLPPKGLTSKYHHTVDQGFNMNLQRDKHSVQNRIWNQKRSSCLLPLGRASSKAFFLQSWNDWLVGTSSMEQMGNIHITQAKLSAGWTAAHLDKLCSDTGHGPCFSQYLLHWLFAFMVEHIGGGSHDKGNRCTFCSCFYEVESRVERNFGITLFTLTQCFQPSLYLFQYLFQFTVNTSSATNSLLLSFLLGLFACLFICWLASENTHIHFWKVVS